MKKLKIIQCWFCNALFFVGSLSFHLGISQNENVKSKDKIVPKKTNTTNPKSATDDKSSYRNNPKRPVKPVKRKEDITTKKKLTPNPSAKSMSTKTDKLIIYQMMFHLWGNKNTTNKFNGSAEENGVTKFKDLNDLAITKLKQFGYSHLYLTGILEHATMEDFTTLGIPRDHPDVVKGRCGSPYAVKDYYDVNPFLAINPKNRMSEFESMVGRVHKSGLKIVLDFVPNHVARFYHSDMKSSTIKDFGEGDDVNQSFTPNNNFYYLPDTKFEIPSGVVSPVKAESPYVETPAKVSGNDVFSAKPTLDDWFETVKLNYGVDMQQGGKKHFTPIPSTWIKMVDILKYWAAKGVDGFRCDMAEMVPVEFWQYALQEVKQDFPNVIFIAEIYNPKEYRNYVKIGGFDYLYDKVGLYDGLRRLIEQRPTATVEDITSVWQNESGDISQNMLRFLENHDEQRINSAAFAKGNPFAAVPAMVVTATLHTGPLMIYFGQELGETADESEGFSKSDGRTTIFDFWGVPSHQAWMNDGKFDGGKLNQNQKFLREFYGDLLKFVNSSDAIKFGEFYDLQFVQGEGYDKKLVYSYLRYVGKQKLLFVCNFSHSKQQEINLNIPEGAWNSMKINMDTKLFLSGKFNQKNTIEIDADKPITLKISPNSVLIYEISEKKL